MQNKYNKEGFQAELEKLSIDFLIVSSSFEERCFIVPQLSINYVKKTYVLYNDNEVEMIVKNAAQLLELMGQKKSEKISLNSDEPVDSFIKILKTFSIICCTDKPNILIDTTTFTHETLLVLIKLVNLNKHTLGKIFLAYVGADCYSINEKNDNDKWLSKGIKTIRTVLGYPGFTDPTQENHLIVLFGFESERTKQIIEEYEFEHVSLGLGNVGSSIQDNHQKINSERHKKLLEEYPNAEAFSFSLIDPYKTKEDILKHLSSGKYKNLNTVIAPLNNKLSTVGVSLAAIENENIQLAYAKPMIYNIDGYSRPNNDIYLYELTI